MNKLLIACCTIAFLLFPPNLGAQIDTAFVAHLWKQQLELEHVTYLNQHLSQGDTANYHLAKHYLQYANEPAFFAHLESSESLFFKDTSAMNLASTWLLSANGRTRWFDSALVHAPLLPNTARQTLNIHRSIASPQTFNESSLPLGLQADFMLYRKSAAKKPINSLLLSAAVPGLGKLYIGNRRSAALTFISLAVLGLQSVESYRKVGVAHPLTIINLGFFTTYYVVNLLGSYRETKSKSREIRNQYLIHASTYYRYKYPDQLYR